jgi:hypothetical protein
MVMWTVIVTLSFQTHITVVTCSEKGLFLLLWRKFLKFGFGLHLFCRPEEENKMVNAEPEKSSLPATVASTMIDVS